MLKLFTNCTHHVDLLLSYG